jgi:hypothetical protein
MVACSCCCSGRGPVDAWFAVGKAPASAIRPACAEHPEIVSAQLPACHDPQCFAHARLLRT